MKGGIAAHMLTNKANNTPNPKHMTVKNYDPNARKTLSIEAIEAECEKLNVDMNRLLALALSDDMRARAQESGMTMKEQAALIMKIRDKEIAQKKDITVTGELEIGVIQRRIIDPRD